MTLRELLTNWNENDVICLFTNEHRKIIETTVRRLFRMESPYLENTVEYSTVETILNVTIDLSDKKAIQLVKMIDKICLEENSCIGCPFYNEKEPFCYMRESVESFKKRHNC